jgi:hypothetical protein
MKGFRMNSLNADAREIIEELDADGSGFRTGEAAGLLVRRYVVAGVCDADGEPKPKVRTLMRMGAGVVVKNYKPAHRENTKRRETAAAMVGSAQHDFMELADDWEFAWLMDYAAFDESDDAARKVLVRMTLPEVRAVIALKRKKAAETSAEADELQNIIDRNPSWHDHPSMTLADVLGIAE